MSSRGINDELVAAAQALRAELDGLKFGAPVVAAYNPLEYAWAAHEMYLRRYGCGRKRVVFLGMNPGPFGMVQTGVPFGEINAVRSWLKIEALIGRPPREHPKRPVTGFACQRSEVSGRRLWGLFAARFGPAENFFAEHFVANYCPLAFFGESGANLTPDKLGKQAAPLLEACDRHLRRVLEALEPEWVIGIGDFAERRAKQVVQGLTCQTGKVLHPSPASPVANRDWAAQATAQLRALGIWR